MEQSFGAEQATEVPEQERANGGAEKDVESSREAAKEKAAEDVLAKFDGFLEVQREQEEQNPTIAFNGHERPVKAKCEMGMCLAQVYDKTAKQVLAQIREENEEKAA